MNRIIFSVLLCVAALTGSATAAQPVELADDAPDAYTVVRGDTLWDISAHFLKEPWRWPEVWRMNRSQIQNPHLIYPGQVIVLDRRGPWLSIGRRVGAPLYEKRFPQAYSKATEAAVPSIPVKAIEPFLTRPLVVDEKGLATAGTIVATDTSRVMMGAGDIVFAKGVPADTNDWQVFRPARPLVDPITNEVLGYEAEYLGSGHVTAHGLPATLKLTDAVEEITTGDRLVPAERPQLFAYVPHAPQADVQGHLVSIYRGVAEAGRNSVVAISLGRRDGLEPGHVLALYRNRGAVDYKEEDGARETYQLPEQRYGLVFVFRVFDRVSYALVTNTDGPAIVGDSVRKP